MAGLKDHLGRRASEDGADSLGADESSQATRALDARVIGAGHPLTFIDLFSFQLATCNPLISVNHNSD